MRNVDLFNHNRLFWGLQKMKPFHKIRTMKAKTCNPPKSEATMKLTITIELDDSKLHDENGYFDAVPEIKRTLALIDDDALQEGEILDGDNSIGIIALD